MLNYCIARSRLGFLVLCYSLPAFRPFSYSIATMKAVGVVFGLAAVVAAHGDHSNDQDPILGPHGGLWYNTLPGDGGTQVR